MSESYIIRKMTLSDANLIEKDFQENFDEFWNINILKSELENPNSYYICFTDDQDGLVGFAGILKIVDEGNLMNIVTRVDKRDQGIGSLMLEKLINISKEFKLKTLTLEVNSENYPAIKLYEKYNFEKKGLRKKYYNNTYDAIIMTKIL